MFATPATSDWGSALSAHFLSAGPLIMNKRTFCSSSSTAACAICPMSVTSVRSVTKEIEEWRASCD